MEKTAISVLVIEDNPLEAARVAGIINQFTDDITLVLTAERGLAIFKGALRLDRPFDLVVTDVLLPGMNGKDLLKEIRHIEKGLPGVCTKVIVVSADDPHRHLLEACREGADCYLEKPLTKEKLETALAKTGLVKLTGATLP